MNHSISVHTTQDFPEIPSAEAFQAWIDAVLHDRHRAGAVDIRIVDEAEIAELNKNYRGKNRPTNVLAFPFEIPAVALTEMETPLLGDLVICAAVVRQEALQQNKSIQAHWAHLVVHGCLHLLGYDHMTEEQAEEMEGLEIQILNTLKFPNPYAPSGESSIS